MHPEDVASGKASSVLQSEQVHADFHGGLHDLFRSSSELIDQMEHTDGKHSLSVEVDPIGNFRDRRDTGAYHGKGVGTSAAEIPRGGKSVSTSVSKSAIGKAKTDSRVQKNAVKQGVGTSAAEVPKAKGAGSKLTEGKIDGEPKTRIEK